MLLLFLRRRKRVPIAQKKRKIRRKQKNRHNVAGVPQRLAEKDRPRKDRRKPQRKQKTPSLPEPEIPDGLTGYPVPSHYSRKRENCHADSKEKCPDEGKKGKCRVKKRLRVAKADACIKRRCDECDPRQARKQHRVDHRAAPACQRALMNASSAHLLRGDSCGAEPCLA